MDEASFWHSISIFVTNYHVVNRKLFACIIEQVHKRSGNVAQGAVQEAPGCDDEMLDYLRAYTPSDDIEGFRIEFKFLSKHLDADIRATGIIDFPGASYALSFPNAEFANFCVSHRNGQVEVSVLNSKSAADVASNERWVNFVLKPKLLTWSRKSEAPIAGRSLRLIDLEYYNKLYKELKQKYSEKVLKFWNEANESTDPLKFIYEDLAIAAYLITLWRLRDNGASRPTAFADLGCGNGLLVYILNEEGFAGYGYDVRARKIWSHYPSTIKLIEQTVHPADFQCPAEVDWLIGNHSDELSPWVPVMAANASYDMKYFLLPCCGFEFNGAKFQRRNSRVSAYQDLYGYLMEISGECGFETLEDRLKIPSTKRLAILAVKRLYPRDEYETKRQKVLDYVKRQTSGSIKLRERAEVVRNCTKVDRDVINGLVKKIFNALLEASCVKRDHSGNWKSGGSLRMPDIARILSKEDLLHIKSECGGIKTLLRNKHEIFEFRGGDLVGIRRPAVTTQTSNKLWVKKRKCFFKENHPNGCPLDDNQCTFIH